MIGPTSDRVDRLFLPPYRCCGASTRKIVLRNHAKGYDPEVLSYICDACGWSYDKNGVRRQPNGQVRKRKLNEVD